MKQFITVSFFSLFLFWSCGPSSRITSSWKTPEAQTKSYKKIVVLGLIRDADRTIREKMEQHMASDLKELGYDAVCSCDEYNPKAFEGLSENDAIVKLRNSGVDAVLTITLLDKQKEKYYVPGRVGYPANYNYQNRFYSYYHTMNNRVYSKGYYVTDTRYFWESNFYDMESNSLIYSAQSQSFDPASTESLAHEYGQMIIKDMVKSSVIVNKRTSELKAM